MAAADRGPRWYDVLWRILRPAAIFLTACLLVVGALSIAARYVYRNFLMPVDETDKTPIAVTIKRGSSISAIARQLKEADIIRNKGVFQYMADFMGKGGKLKAGEYELNRAMTLTQVMDALEEGDGGQEVMTFRLIEGTTIEEMGASLVEQGVFKDDKRFLELCRSGEAFRADYPFLAETLDSEDEGKLYKLEGYLFPDTYEIYIGSSEETIIAKMLSRMKVIYGIQYMERAEELNMSMDEVLTLASMIQKEGKRATFSKVSSVFHNRLKKDMYLGSDVTVQYALGIRNLVLTQSQLDADSPYNTYIHKGLPVGPVCNPGNEAIDAALYPDEEYLDEEYLYFTLTDPETGELFFSKSLEEHNEAVERYRPLWEAYDEKVRAAQAAKQAEVEQAQEEEKENGTDANP